MNSDKGERKSTKLEAGGAQAAPAPSDTPGHEQTSSGLSSEHTPSRELLHSSPDLTVSSSAVSSSHEFLASRRAREAEQAGATVGQEQRQTKTNKRRRQREKPLKRTKERPALADTPDGPAPAAQTGKHALIVVLFLIGLIVCVTSLVCLLLLPSFVSQQIAKKLVLKNNSQLLERWSRPNVPMHFRVWLFNVKNAQELIDRRHTVPQLEEVGPFVFNLRRRKDVVSFAGDNLFYTERRVYHFNRELSCCPINTTLTLPNVPLVAVVDRALGLNLPLVNRFVPRLINRAIGSLREQLFVRKQARELIFDGYDVELLRVVGRISALVGQPKRSQRFAIFKGRNDTWRPEQDGVWAINTGQRDRKQFGRVTSWNSYKKLPFWPEASCNKINGSDGTLFPPPISKSQPLYIFNPELCRTINLVYDGPSEVRSIQSYRFVLNPLNFAHTMVSARAAAPSAASASQSHRSASGASETQPPPAAASPSPDPLRPAGSERQTVVGGTPAAPTANTLQRQTHSIRLAQERQLASERRTRATPLNPQTCFCDRKTTHLNGVNVCEFDGLIDLSRCSKEAQVIFGSMPHFHNADARLLAQTAGLAPNATRHTTYLDIEPNTGLVLGGKRRVQLNVLIKHNNQIEGFENIRDMLVPIVWFEESAMIPEDSAQKFRSLYIERVRLINWTLASLLLGSLVLLAVDARLLFATSSWRRFKVTPPAGQVKSVSGGGSGAAGDGTAACQAGDQKGAAGEAAGARQPSIKLPLLEHKEAPSCASNTLASSYASSSAWSGGVSAPSSPEMRKWWRPGA